MGLGVPGWRQAPGARSGLGRWPLGMGAGWGGGRLKGFCWRSIGPSTVASRPPWRGLTLLAQDTEVKATEQEEALVLRLDELEFSRPGPSPPPPSLREPLGDASVELCLHVCLFSFALPAQKQGPTGGKEGVCVLCGARTAWERGRG